jgi:hypothetical protein
MADKREASEDWVLEVKAKKKKLKKASIKVSPECKSIKLGTLQDLLLWAFDLSEVNPRACGVVLENRTALQKIIVAVVEVGLYLTLYKQQLIFFTRDWIPLCIQCILPDFLAWGISKRHTSFVCQGASKPHILLHFLISNCFPSPVSHICLGHSCSRVGHPFSTCRQQQSLYTLVRLNSFRAC